MTPPATQLTVELGMAAHGLSPRKEVPPRVSAVQGEVSAHTALRGTDRTVKGAVACGTFFCPFPTASPCSLTRHRKGWLNKLLSNHLTKLQD